MRTMKINEKKLSNVNVLLVAEDTQTIPAHISYLMSCAADFQLVNWYTNNIDELAIIAKHRVMPGVTLMLLNNQQKVIARVAGFYPTPEQIETIVDNI